MAINSIVLQPAELAAAYRPIVFRVAAERTDGNPIPPVVYCDIYFAGIFYKTISRTQYESTSVSESVFLFDISDAAQEFLRQQLPVNGGVVFIVPSLIFTECYCKFRSTGFDADGFLIPEGTAPIQGTGSAAPVSGTGTQSDTTTVINASLQHEDNQDLVDHLQSLKPVSGWDPDAMPLTHRPSPYKVCKGDSDYYPFVDLQDRQYTCIKLSYKLKGDADFTEVQSCVECVPPAVGTVTIPAAIVGSSYLYMFNLTAGTESFGLSVTARPAWMTIDIDGSTVTLSGMPTAAGTFDVIFTISNDCGTLTITKTIVVTVCAASAVTDSELTDATAGEAYEFHMPISGTAPFTIHDVIKPAWMTVVIVGSEVVLTGTPTVAAEPVEVSFNVTNCSEIPSEYSHTITVVDPPAPELTIAAIANLTSFSASLNTPVDANIVIATVFADTFSVCGGSVVGTLQHVPGVTLPAGSTGITFASLSNTGTRSFHNTINPVNINGSPVANGDTITVGSFSVLVHLQQCS